MLNDGQIPRNVPNWWNPYAPNIGQKDPQKKLKVINTIKLIVVVITMLGGAILALTINVFGPNSSTSRDPRSGRQRLNDLELERQNREEERLKDLVQKLKDQEQIIQDQKQIITGQEQTLKDQEQEIKDLKQEIKDLKKLIREKTNPDKT